MTGKERMEPRKESQPDTLREQVKELVYVFSHDMRNPLVNLQALIGEINDLLDEARSGNPDILEAELPDVVSMMDTSIGRLNDLITGANELYHCMFDEIEREEVELQKLVERIVARYRERPELSFEFDSLPVIFADPLFLGRMIELLIESAAHGAGEKGVVVSLSADVREREGELTVRSRGDETSAGRSGDESGYSRPDSGQESSAVAGMELVIVRAIAEAHGGKFRDESVPGGESLIHIRLPRAAG